ncbi:MAG: nuclear transport factor 2 family protein [Alphaproteobacteria bacterium]|nr:nuclear transport factor 2 family protein [Alphaproteobacteria bacterium]
MPIITVTLMEGYSEAVRSDLSARLTHAARAATGAVPDGVTVVVQEVPPANYMRGGRHRTPGTPPPPASELVRSYLAAMEARDLAAARSHLTEGFVMTFPGGATFRTVEELIEWAKPRYRSVAKSYERFDEAPNEDGVAVYCHGHLHGEWPDGTPFSGIRFIDRFTVDGGKLIDQQVWNDLAETPTGR